MKQGNKHHPRRQSRVRRRARTRDIIARLDGELDPDAAEAWMEEIATRAREARAGAPAAGDWQEVCDAIEADILQE